MEPEDEKIMFELVRAGFNMRRKTLWNAGKAFGLFKDLSSERSIYDSLNN